MRAATTSYLDDPEVRQLIDELSAEGREFRRFLSTQGVMVREGRERAINRPTMGRLHYQQVSLSLAGWPDFRLTMLVPKKTSRRSRAA